MACAGNKARAKPELRISHGHFTSSALIAHRVPNKVTRDLTRVGPQLGDPGCWGGGG